MNTWHFVVTTGSGYRGAYSFQAESEAAAFKQVVEAVTKQRPVDVAGWIKATVVR